MKINEKKERMMTKVKFVKDVIFSSYRKKYVSTGILQSLCFSLTKGFKLG